MSSRWDEDEGRSAEFEEVLGGYLDRLAQGGQVEAEEVLADHPELAADLLREIETFEGLARKAGRGRSDGELGVLGDYRLLRQLGRGGMGVVYEAWQGSLDRAVALKVLPAGVAADTKSFMRFVREARVAGKLRHPNVVSVYGMGVEEETPYYAMELVDGATLAQVLARVRSRADSPADGARERAAGDSLEDALGAAALSLVDSAGIAEAFAGVADGLQHAHEQNVIHRDVKPSNLILEGGRRLRVLDFGLARLEGQSSLTLSGDLMGTPSYMSPEQALARKVPIDRRTDIYSLGATLYEALTLRPPFRGKDHQDTLSQIVHRDPQPLRRAGSPIPRDLATIVLKCLAKDPRDRYATAEALAQDLRRFARGQAIEARPQPRWERLARRAWRRKAGILLAAAVAVALLSLAAILHQRAVERRRFFEAEVRDQVVEIQLWQNAWGFRKAVDVAWLPEFFARRLELALERLREAEAALPDVPAVPYHRARVLLNLERDEEAFAEIDQALRIDAGFVPAIALRALLLELGSDADAARAEMERAEAAAPSGWKKDWLHAHRAANDEHWPEAAAAYGDLVGPGLRGEEFYLGSFVDTLFGQGFTRLEAKQYERALEVFSAAEALWPGKLQSTLLKGQTYVLLGKRDLADEEFEKSFSNSRDSAEVAWWVSATYFFLNHTEDALSWARRSIPGSSLLHRADLLVQEGGILHQLGNEDFVKAFEQAFALAPQSSRDWAIAGWGFHNYGLTDRAETCFRMAIRLNPRFSSPYIGLAFVLSDRNEVEEPLRLCGVALQFQRRSVLTLMGMARVLADQGRLTEAESWLRKALIGDPDKQPNTWKFLGRTLLEVGRFDEAVQALERSIAICPHILYGQENLGEAYRRWGRIDKAIECLRHAASRAPQDAGVRLRLGEALQQKGDLEDALAEYATVIRSRPESKESFEHIVALLRLLDRPLPTEGSLAKLDDALEFARCEGVADPMLTKAVEMVRIHRGSPQEFAAARAKEIARIHTGERGADAEGDLPKTAQGLRQRLIEDASAGRDLWDLWAAISLADLGRSPAELLVEIPPSRESGPGDDLRWLLEQLRSDTPIRINAGGEEYKSAGGIVWSRDRFFLGGKTTRTFRGDVKDTADDALYQTERWFPAWEDPPAGYRIPLPRGRYRVTLHFAEVWFGAPGLRTFDVRIDGAEVLTGYDPFAGLGFATAESKSREASVDDGLLEIEFIHRTDNPNISAIEIERVD